MLISPRDTNRRRFPNHFHRNSFPDFVPFEFPAVELEAVDNHQTGTGNADGCFPALLKTGVQPKVETSRYGSRYRTRQENVPVRHLIEVVDLG